MMIEADAYTRWNTWIVQAKNFSEKEQHVDAVGRIRLVCEEINEALQHDPNQDGSHRKLRALQTYAKSLREEFETACESWRAELEQKRLQRIADADEEMRRPIPGSH